MNKLKVIETGRFKQNELTNNKMSKVKGGIRICLCDKRFGGSGKHVVEEAVNP